MTVILSNKLMKKKERKKTRRNIWQIFRLKRDKEKRKSSMIWLQNK